MKKSPLIILLNILVFAADAQSIKNNGHHSGGGNSGNGKGNGAYQEEDPAEVPGDPDEEPTEVPLDNTAVLLLLCGGVVVYGLIKNRKGTTV